MVQAILNKFWKQHPTKHQLYSHITPISKTIQVKQTRHAGHSWRSKDEFISDVLLWTSTHGCASVGQLARTYLNQLCADTGSSLENLPGAMNDGDRWRERESGKSVLTVQLDDDDDDEILCIWSDGLKSNVLIIGGDMNVQIG